MGKKKKPAPTKAGYHHELDPYTLHGTQKEATDHEKILVGTVKMKRRKARVSTFYTILQDRRKNNPKKFGNVPQGPHTFPHYAIHRGIANARRSNKLTVFHALIPSPKDYNAIVNKEIPEDHQKRARANEAMRIYEKTHKKFRLLKSLGKKRDVEQEVSYAHTINRLIQMHPYGSYAYKGTGASKKARAGKGESSDNKTLAQKIDLPSNHGFNDKEAPKTRNQKLLSILTDLGVK